MAETTQSLRDIARERFKRAFGEPHREAGQDLHWALRPMSYMAAINLIFDGGEDDRPTVWVFDPHDARDGVKHSVIKHESEIGPLIERIEEQVKFAGGRRTGD